MTFQPVVSGPGIAGWIFLQRTYDQQIETFKKTPQLERDSAYFLENIGKVTSARELVEDRRLLSVALGAFGLQDDINNRYLIRRMLEDGTTDKDALANKFTDDRYKRLSEAFGFGPGELRKTGSLSRMTKIVEMNRVQSFEVAVGNSDEDMRIALYAQRELRDLAREDVSDETKWFRLMALPPLRQMFETALGLPKAFGQIDIDQQLGVFQDRMRSVTGDATVAQFTDPEAMKKLTNLFLARSQISSFGTATSAGANALAILRG